MFDPITGKTHYRLHPKLERAGFWPFMAQLKRRYAEEMNERPLVIVLDNASAHGYVDRGWSKWRTGCISTFCRRIVRD